MIRNLKVLGLIAVTLVLSARFASAVQAQSGTFTAGATLSTHTSTVIKGTQYGGVISNYFRLGENNVNCSDSNVGFTGSDGNGTATSLTLTPSYKHCTAGSLPATVTMNGCDYDLNQPFRIGIGEYTGTLDLMCPFSQAVVVHTYLFGGVTSHSVQVCTQKILPANGLGHVIYKNQVTASGKDDITAAVTLTTLNYEQSGTCGTASGFFGEYRSTITLTAASGAGQPHDLWLSF